MDAAEEVKRDLINSRLNDVGESSRRVSLLVHEIRGSLLGEFPAPEADVSTKPDPVGWLDILQRRLDEVWSTLNEHHRLLASVAYHVCEHSEEKE